MQIRIYYFLLVLTYWIGFIACKQPAAKTTEIAAVSKDEKRIQDSISRADLINYNPAKIAIPETLPENIKNAIKALEAKSFSEGNLGEQLIGFAKVGQYDLADKFKFFALMWKEKTAELQTKSYVELDELAEVMSQFPNMKIGIESYTDNVGGEAKNQKLTEARAALIKKYLVSKGINDTRIKATGFGQTLPVGDNKLEEGRIINDRVEIQLYSFN